MSYFNNQNNQEEWEETKKLNLSFSLSMSRYIMHTVTLMHDSFYQSAGCYELNFVTNL